MTYDDSCKDYSTVQQAYTFKEGAKLVDIFIWLVSHQITLAALCLATLAGIFIGALIQFLEDNKKATPHANAKQPIANLIAETVNPRQWVDMLMYLPDTATVYHDCYVRVTAYLRTVEIKSGGQLEPML